MKKILVLTEAQYNAVVNAVSDAVMSVNNGYGEDCISMMNDEDDYLSFAGTEMPSEHMALESINWRNQTSDKPQWVTDLIFPNHPETENLHYKNRHVFDNFEDAFSEAQEMAEQYAIDAMHASIIDGKTCHMHVRQYAMHDSDSDNVIDVYDDPSPDCTRYDYKVIVVKV